MSPADEVLASQAYPELTLVPALPRVGAAGLAGFGLSEEQRGMVQRFEPSVTNSIGFFIARFVKGEHRVRGEVALVE